jgi:hypothetical protein
MTPLFLGLFLGSIGVGSAGDWGGLQDATEPCRDLAAAGDSKL